MSFQPRNSLDRRVRRWALRLLLVLALGVVAMYSDAARATGDVYCTAVSPIWNSAGNCRAAHINTAVAFYGAGSTVTYTSNVQSETASTIETRFYGEARRPNGSATGNFMEYYTYQCKSGYVWQHTPNHGCVTAPPPTCDVPAGSIHDFTYRGSGTPQAQICSGNCAFNSPLFMSWHFPGSGTTVSTGTYTSTGVVCNANLPTQYTQGGMGEECSTVQGHQVCTGGSVPDHCFKVDGETSCYSEAGEFCTTPDCTSTLTGAQKQGDGSAVAPEGTPTPTAPNTGTPGQRATPDFSLTRNTTTAAPGATTTTTTSLTIDYWGSGTVGTSNTSDGSVGGTNGGGDGGGDGGGEGDCDPATEQCEGEGEGDCDPATEQCDEEGGDKGTVKGPGGTARSFGASVGAVRTAFNASPAMTKLNGLSIPGGGSCPAPTIDMPYLNRSITMNAHCQLAQGIRSELRAIFLALWVIVAVGVFLRP